MNLDTFLDRALAADNGKDFINELHAGYQLLAEPLDDEGANMTELLVDAFTRHPNNLRRRRALEVCIWPIFDKPGLPLKPAVGHQFLWLFAVPFVVRLKPKALGTDLKMVNAELDAKSFLAQLVHFHPFAFQPDATKCKLTMFSTLYRREDLHLLGPLNISEQFLLSDAGVENEVPLPLPFQLDEGIPTGRTILLYALCAAKLKRGEPLPEFNRIKPAPEQSRALTKLVKEFLERAGIPVEQVKTGAPNTVGEALFTCAGSGVDELRGHIELGKALYGPKMRVLARVPADGYAEIYGVKPGGDQVVLAPPFRFLEPVPELHRALFNICKDLNLLFSGCFKPNLPCSTTLN